MKKKEIAPTWKEPALEKVWTLTVDWIEDHLDEVERILAESDLGVLAMPMMAFRKRGYALVAGALSQVTMEDMRKALAMSWEIEHFTYVMLGALLEPGRMEKALTRYLADWAGTEKSIREFFRDEFAAEMQPLDRLMKALEEGDHAHLRD